MKFKKLKMLCEEAEQVIDKKAVAVLDSNGDIIAEYESMPAMERDFTPTQISRMFKDGMIVYKDEVNESIDLTNKIKGGLADGKTLADIASKHSVPLKLINQQYRMGIQVEREHTNDKEKASEIAMDHLWEDPKYYTKLRAMESE